MSLTDFFWGISKGATPTAKCNRKYFTRTCNRNFQLLESPIVFNGKNKRVLEGKLSELITYLYFSQVMITDIRPQNGHCKLAEPSSSAKITG